MKKQVIIHLFILITLAACQPVDLNTPALEFDTGINPEAWVVIPTGEFLAGQFNNIAAIDYDYEMMVTDVTNDQYTAFLNDALTTGSAKIHENEVVGFYPGDEFRNGRHEELIESGDYIYIPIANPALRLTLEGQVFKVKDNWGDHPMTMVSWFGAKAFCEYYGWRLPTELEWEKAARGTDGRPFPWGNNIASENANFTSSHDPFEDMSFFGSRTTPVGFYNGKIYSDFHTIDSPSPYGLYDMAGNVWQWTADIYAGQHYRYMRGGSKNSYENNLRVWSRNNASPIFVSPAVGFRCVR
jgi:formylglycine-generating enzyme required for sulfatase activity